MPRHTWALAVALCAPALGSAAPAPQQRLVTAEAVVAPHKANPREAATRLTSATVLEGVVRSQAAARLACLRGEKDPARWLAARLRVSVDDKRDHVVLRLVDCPRSDAIALLTAVVEAYTGGSRHDRAVYAAQQQREAQIQFLIAVQAAQAGGGGVPWAAIDTSSYYDGSLRGARQGTVIQAPRIVPAPVFGRAAPAR
jgi:hypothetical protein